jgi:MFS transporter, DHA1 family, tetracycline resistance protein
MKNKSLMTIFFVVFIDLFGFGIILPLLPFIGEKYGAKPFEIGLLAATYSLFQLISTPVLGRLSDRYGRKKLLIFSQIGTAIGFLMLAFANSLPLIFLSRIIDGATGGNISIAQAYIADVTTKEDRAKGMGLIGAAFGLGFIFGPAIGGFLSKFGFQAPALFATFISLVTVFATIFFLKESVDIKKAQTSPKTSFSFAEMKRTLTKFPIGLLILSFLLINMAFSSMQSIFPLWAAEAFKYGPQQNGLIFAYIGVLVVIMQLIVLPRMVKKFGEKKLLVLALFSLSFGLFLQPVYHVLWFLLFSMVFIAFGNALSNPTIQSLASKSVPPEEYGGTLGFLQSAGAFGRITGPVLGGFLFQTLGNDSPFYAGGFILLILLIYIYLKYGRK